SAAESSDSVAKPPSMQPGDPPFISLNDAIAKYQFSEVIFIDTRDTADFKQAHIKGAVNLPYDYYELFWDEVMKTIPRGRPIVTYCSGDACESSLMLGRELMSRGYGNVYIFYGGWSVWLKAGLPTERGQ
ncbi:MAG: rhodanese-like domain-containing protein, partial [candidate division Zixibacteria bacterium]|nr:rhodanese-like domain-containing protein [candidate division Zixibacteria bacterium]